jgi:hypothetical protein
MSVIKAGDKSKVADGERHLVPAHSVTFGSGNELKSSILKENV